LQNRRPIYLLLAGALFCAVSILLLMHNIAAARQQFQKTDPGTYNYILQADRSFDRFLSASYNYRLSENPESRESAVRQLQTRFDIIWSTFRVFEISVNNQQLSPVAMQLGDDVKNFLSRYDEYYSGKLPLTEDVVETSADEVLLLSNRLYSLALAVFEQSARFRDSITDHIDELYRYFWIFGLLLIVTGTWLIAKLFQLNNHSTRLFNEARESEVRLESVVEELRSGKKEQKAKDSFLAAASHDLRQPLHALGLFVSALENKVKLPEGPVILDKIKQSTEALNSLFNSLLDISRLDAGVVEITHQHFYIDDLLHNFNFTEEFKEVAAQRNLAFKISPCDSIAHTDYVLLGRILRNLIDNAIVHTREGEVRVSCERKGAHLHIQVADTGPGIPIEEHDSIFSEYYQLNNPERDRSKGLGLGLSIVRRLSDLLDLQLTLHSDSGIGTTFSLAVPVGRVDSVVTRSPKSVVETEMDFEGVLVLVIDDEKDVRDGMEMMLREVNCTVLSVESDTAAQAVVVQRDLMPALIIADYRLREDKTGDEAIALIRDELNRDIPALIITGDTSPERVREAAQSGTRLLHKPVTPNVLVAAVRELLQDDDLVSKAAS